MLQYKIRHVFPNAVSSAEVNISTCSYTLPYLAEGTYDLVVAEYHDGNYTRYFGPIEDVEVDKNETTSRDIDTSNL